jgi:hypothetical protein
LSSRELESGFQFRDGSKHVIKNQPLNSKFFELILRSLDYLRTDRTWSVEVIIAHALKMQKSVVIYSPLLVTSHCPEAHFVTPVLLARISNLLFQNSTLYLGVRISDDASASPGAPAVAGTSVPAACPCWSAEHRASLFADGLHWRCAGAAASFRRDGRPSKLSSMRLLLRMFASKAIYASCCHNALESRFHPENSDGRPSFPVRCQFALKSDNMGDSDGRGFDGMERCSQYDLPGMKSGQ